MGLCSGYRQEQKAPPQLSEAETNPQTECNCRHRCLTRLSRYWARVSPSPNPCNELPIYQVCTGAGKADRQQYCCPDPATKTQLFCWAGTVLHEQHGSQEHAGMSPANAQ